MYPTEFIIVLKFSIISVTDKLNKYKQRKNRNGQEKININSSYKAIKKVCSMCKATTKNRHLHYTSATVS